MRLAGCFAIVLLTGLVAMASERSLVTAWYEALKASDRGAFNELLDRNAVIDLKQLGITQTKAEFMAALDSWDAVVGELVLTHSLETSGPGRAEATVCYAFGDEAHTNLETFFIDRGKVMRLEQERLMEGC